MIKSCRCQLGYTVTDRWQARRHAHLVIRAPGAFARMLPSFLISFCDRAILT
jgi:hypothetical protein